MMNRNSMKDPSPAHNLPRCASRTRWLPSFCLPNRRPSDVIRLMFPTTSKLGEISAKVNIRAEQARIAECLHYSERRALIQRG